MKPKYMCLYDSWRAETDQLTLEEKGRLIDACMAYFTGEELPTLTGNERFVFGSFKARIDANIEAYDRKCEQNARNIKKRWEKETAGEDTNEYDGIRSNTNVYERYQYNKIKENITEKNTTEQNRTEQNTRAIEQANRIGLIRTEADRIRLIELVEQYGIDKVLYGIDQADRNGGKFVSYVERVCVQSGNNKPGKKVPAQDFTQREYTPNDDYIDGILNEKETESKNDE